MGRYDRLGRGDFLGRTATSLPLIPVRVKVAGEGVLHAGLLGVTADANEVTLSIRGHGRAHPVHGWARPSPDQRIEPLGCEVEDLLLELVEEEIREGLQEFARRLLDGWNETVTRAAQQRHERERATARYRAREAAERKRQLPQPTPQCGHAIGYNDARGEPVTCQLPAGHRGDHVCDGVCIGPGPGRTVRWPTDAERAARKRHADEARERERERQRHEADRSARCGHAHPQSAQLRCMLPPGHSGRHGANDMSVGQADWRWWGNAAEAAPSAEPVHVAMRISRDGVLVYVPPEPELSKPPSLKRRRR